MKGFLIKFLKVLKWMGIVLLSLIIILLIVRFVGKLIFNRTPDGGINETMYVDVNGQQMWINIYSENKDNPVLLFLHGGPGYSTSYGDYVILRKLAKDYTVVNWDQRNCGKTWLKDPQEQKITIDMLRDDIDVLTDYLLEYMDKDKLTIMGISWGSFYALDFAQNHPEKTECCIGLSQAVGYYDKALEYGLSINFFAADFFRTSDKLSAEDHELAQKINDDELLEAITPDSEAENESIEIFMKLVGKYSSQLDAYMYDNGYMVDMFDDCDENLISAVLFSPYYSLPEIYKSIFVYPEAENGVQTYDDVSHVLHLQREDSGTLLDRTEYQVPVYMFLAENDYTCNPRVAEEYFNSITAPYKELRYTSGGHESTMYHSEELAAFVHYIAEKQKELNSD